MLLLFVLVRRLATLRALAGPETLLCQPGGRQEQGTWKPCPLHRTPRAIDSRKACKFCRPSTKGETAIMPYQPPQVQQKLLPACRQLWASCAQGRSSSPSGGLPAWGTAPPGWNPPDRHADGSADPDQSAGA